MAKAVAIRRATEVEKLEACRKMSQGVDLQTVADEYGQSYRTILAWRKQHGSRRESSRAYMEMAALRVAKKHVAHLESGDATASERDTFLKGLRALETPQKPTVQTALAVKVDVGKFGGYTPEDE